jgi:hypothetical protein
MNITEAFVNTVLALTPDLDSIYETASKSTRSGWESQQKGIVTASGIGSSLIPVPGLHLPAAVADVALLVNRMGMMAWGVGAIYGSDEEFGNILEEEDLVPILGYWANDEETKHNFKVKGGLAVSKVAAKLGGKVAAKAVSKTVLASLGYIVAKKAGLKAVAKAAPPLVSAATVFAGKAGVKVGTSWVPVAGAAINSSINYWIISSISTAASAFYNDKLNIIADIED